MLDAMYERPETDSSGVSYALDAGAIANNLGLSELPQRKAKEAV
jgi:hypothetical protein